MMKSEVTQEVYQRVMGESLSAFTDCGTNCPVENVTRQDAVYFANAEAKKRGVEQCYSIRRTHFVDLICLFAP